MDEQMDDEMSEAQFIEQMIAHLEGGSRPALDAAGVYRKLCFDFPQPTAAHLATLSTALRSEIGAIARGGGDKLWGELAVSAEFLSGVEYCATASSATGGVRAGAAEVIALVVVKLPRALGDAIDSAAAARFLGDGAREDEDAAFVLRRDELVARARYELFAPIPSARWGALALSRDVVALSHALASPPLLRIASERAVDQRDDAVGAPTLTDDVWLYGGSHNAIHRSIARGRAGYSPAFARRLSAAELRDVAVYVASLAPARTTP